jgi:hypothetical protein
MLQKHKREFIGLSQKERKQRETEKKETRERKQRESESA